MVDSVRNMPFYCTQGTLMFLIVFRSSRSQMIFKIMPSGLEIYLKKTPTQVFSCEYCEIFKNSCFYRTHSAAASMSL